MLGEAKGVTDRPAKSMIRGLGDQLVKSPLPLKLQPIPPSWGVSRVSDVLRGG